MNEQIKALKMAIEALQNVYFENEQLSFVDNAESNWKQRQNAIKACKEALEDISKMETTTQEPYCWLGYGMQAYDEKPFEGATPLYKHPAPTIKQSLKVESAQEPVIVAIAQNEPPRVMLQDKVNGKYMCFDVDSFVQAHLATEQINGFFNAITHPAPSCSCKDKK